MEPVLQFNIGDLRAVVRFREPVSMAESDDEYYLRECLEKGICPLCHKPIVERFGSGQLKDGVFCSLDCFGKWHEQALKRRHQDRVKKDKSG
jgi:hypothetical protein